MAEQRADEGSERSGHTSGLEWVIAALGGMLVLAVLGSMLHEAFAGASTPPVVEVTVDSIVNTRSGYLVQIEARNSGRQTAAGLVIEGVLRDGAAEVESAEITIDFLPARSQRGAGLFFENDPRAHRLQVRAKGYDLP